MTTELIARHSLREDADRVFFVRPAAGDGRPRINIAEDAVATADVATAAYDTTSDMTAAAVRLVFF